MESHTSLSNGEAACFWISGFRSLIDFHINLRPGLNCLVGPNGAGKSNFIDLLDFLSDLTLDEAPTAVSQSGGVARVFSQELLTSKSSVPLKIQVESIVNLDEMRAVESGGKFRFQYFIEIRFNKPSSSLIIKEETLRVTRVYKDIDDAINAEWLGHIQVRRPVYKHQQYPNISVSRKLRSSSARNPFALRRRSYVANRKAVKRRQEEEILSLFDVENFSSDISLFCVVPSIRVPALAAIRRSMTKGRSFHIDPNAARQPDDLSRAPHVDRNGLGLIATLFAIQQVSKGKDSRTYYVGRSVTPQTLRELISLTKLVMPTLRDISVVPDIHSGKYIAHLHIGEDPALKIPFNSVSDGTIKWLTLATVITTAASAYALEEPENFLHPKMQSLLVEFLRDNIDEIAYDYAIISTHSETLINECDPDEIVIFNFLGNRTHAGRVKNRDSLLSEINRTGFGLGYYYARNAIS